MRRWAAASILAAACAPGPPSPADLSPGQEACASCRMAVSEPRFASQVVVPREEPLFFDDLGCLRDHLRRGGVPAGGVAFVADHRDGRWLDARGATYTRVAGLRTPMGSGLVAHADAASRAADPVAAQGAAVSVAELFGSTLSAGGAR